MRVSVEKVQQEYPRRVAFPPFEWVNNSLLNKETVCFLSLLIDTISSDGGISRAVKNIY